MHLVVHIPEVKMKIIIMVIIIYRAVATSPVGTVSTGPPLK